MVASVFTEQKTWLTVVGDSLVFQANEVTGEARHVPLVFGRPNNVELSIAGIGRETGGGASSSGHLLRMCSEISMKTVK